MEDNNKQVKNGIAKDYLKPFDKDFRNYYRKVTANEKHKRLHHYDNDRIIRLFLQKVAERIVDYRAGVNIKKIGYIFVYKHPFLNFVPSLYYNHLKPYMITFIPCENSILKYWSIDFRINKGLRQKMENNVKKGYRYLNLMRGVSKKEYIYLGAPPKVLNNKKIKDNAI